MKTIPGLFRIIAALITLASPLCAAPVMETLAASDYGPYIPGWGKLLRHTDGNFYHMSIDGGAHRRGCLYKVTPQGTITVLYSFGGEGSDFGDWASDGMAGDGNYLWGATGNGGSNGHGTIFKLHIPSREMTRVVDFTGTGGAAPGAGPRGSLVKDDAGYLWGVTGAGGTSNKGTIFKINVSTGVLTTLVHFTGNAGASKGSGASCTLAPDGDGYFWGVTQAGGTSNNGTLFKIRQSTGAFTSLYSFTGGPGGKAPKGGVTHRGNFVWGTTEEGGTENQGGASDGGGTVFKYYKVTGALTTVLIFTHNDGSTKGSGPNAPLWPDGAGNLYGTTSGGGGSGYHGTIYKLAESTGVFTMIDRFHWQEPGSTPTTPFTPDGDGWLWGIGQNSLVGYGIVFKFNPSTQQTVFVAPMRQTVSPLKGPGVNSVIRVSNGELWGTTKHGGDYEKGTVFKMNEQTGAVQTMLEFSGFDGSIEGEHPVANLCEDAFGNVWGTTPGTPVLYKINTGTGTFTHVLSFDSATQGTEPRGALVRDNGGRLWGTCKYGGATGQGTVFMVNPATSAFTTVVHFTGAAGVSRGSRPEVTLVKDGAGMLWGNTTAGGSEGRGVIFKINPTTQAYTWIADFKNTTGPLVGNGGMPMYLDTLQIRGYSRTKGTAGFGYMFTVNTQTNAVTAGQSFNATAPESLTPDNSGFLWGPYMHIPDEEYFPDYAALLKVELATGNVSTEMEFTDVHSYYSGLGTSALVKDGGHLYGGLFDRGPGGAGTLFRLRFGPIPVATGSSNATGTSVQIEGTVNPNGKGTQVAFEWGTTQALGNVITIPNVPAGTDPVPVSTTVTGLTPGTYYYFRVRAVNADHPNYQYSTVRGFKTGL